MVILDFQLDPSEIAYCKNLDDIYAIDAATLLLTHFEMPVRLRVGGSELLEVLVANDESNEETEPIWAYDSSALALVPTHRRPSLSRSQHPSSPWLRLPIVHVATLGRKAVEQGVQQGTSRYGVPDGGRLDFAAAEDVMTVYSTLSERFGTAPSVEVMQAFQEFADKVRVTLLQELPALQEHPVWGLWLQGQAAHPW